MSAEMQTVGLKEIDCELLQRGRALMSAEIHELKGGKVSEFKASTGPRSDERGNWLMAIVLVGSFFASTGPRSDERGNLMLNRGQCKYNERFNGAAL